MFSSFCFVLNQITLVLGQSIPALPEITVAGMNSAYVNVVIVDRKKYHVASRAEIETVTRLRKPYEAFVAGDQVSLSDTRHKEFVVTSHIVSGKQASLVSQDGRLFIKDDLVPGRLRLPNELAVGLLMGIYKLNTDQYIVLSEYYELRGSTTLPVFDSGYAELSGLDEDPIVLRAGLFLVSLSNNQVRPIFGLRYRISGYVQYGLQHNSMFVQNAKIFISCGRFSYQLDVGKLASYNKSFKLPRKT